MKRFLLVLSFFTLYSLALAQNNWNLVWTMKELPFTPYVNDTTKTSSEISIVKAGYDTDEDGWGEFICAWSDLSENYILMYEATGDNTYELVWYFQFPVPANTFPNLAVGDLDNNGIVDIIATQPSQVGTDANPPRLWFFEWNGVQGENKYGRYVDDVSIPHAEWNFGVEDDYDFRPYSQTIEDIDGDGVNELISGARQSTPSSRREVLVSSVTGNLSGFGAFQREFNYQAEFGGSNYSTTTGDLDGDGNKEIYMFVWNNFTFRLFECTGDQQYELAFQVDELYGPESIDYGGLDGVRVADVNGDGVNELYMAGTELHNQIFIITGITDVSQITPGDIQELLTIPTVDQGKFRAMHLADPDRDGNLSMMIAGERNGQIYDVEYNGEGDPADSTSWTVDIIYDIWEASGIEPGGLTPRFFYGHPGGDMDNDGKDEYVFVNWSADFGIWEDDSYVHIIEIGDPTGVSTNTELIPYEISLKQNYPNPFNPSTLIEFALNKSEHTKIVVYDLLGREVAVLVDQVLPAGSHIVNFNAVNLSAGTYFYKLTAGVYSVTKKMLLLK